MSIEKGFKPSAHYDIERLKGGTLEPWITGKPKLEVGCDLKGGLNASLHTINLELLENV